ncbi:MAG: hypothetical protein PHU85_03150 [Phycisphaerae bacterium]|nr:hypothetical protein [Phycisphaerae bacterium]
MNLTKELRRYRDRVGGTLIRGQIVAGVELTADMLGADFPVRFFLHVVFTEKPVSNISPEHNLLQRVLDPTPREAFCVCRSERELLMVLRGKREPRWFLEDESHLVRDYIETTV